MTLMKRVATETCAVLAIIASAMTFAFADVKIRLRTTSGDQTQEGTTYIKDERQRSELIPGAIDILDCDRQQRIQLNERSKVYFNHPVAVKSGGVVTYTANITDTGERKQMFGFTARRLKSSMTSESSPEACDQASVRMEADGWYIDLPVGTQCLASLHSLKNKRTGEANCQDEIRYVESGSGKLGYPAMVTATFLPKDGESYSSTQEIVALDSATLDASLFEVPSDYQQAQTADEFNADLPTSGTEETQGVIDASDNQAQKASDSSATPIAGDFIRIGIIAVDNHTESPISESALRERLINFLDDNGIDAVSITKGSPDELAAEAKRKQCDFMLYTDIVSLKQAGGGKFGGLLGRPSGKYEAQIEFRLLTIQDSQPVLQSTASVKEEGGEEGTLTLALERVAQVVAAEVKKVK